MLWILWGGAGGPGFYQATTPPPARSVGCSLRQLAHVAPLSLSLSPPPPTPTPPTTLTCSHFLFVFSFFLLSVKPARRALVSQQCLYMFLLTSASLDDVSFLNPLVGPEDKSTSIICRAARKVKSIHCCARIFH